MPAKYGRLNVFEVAPENIDLSTKIAQEQVLPQVKMIPGFSGLIALVDRERGRSIALTLWESKEAMEVSEADANRLRGTSADETGERVVSVDRYEVAFTEGINL